MLIVKLFKIRVNHSIFMYYLYFNSYINEYVCMLINIIRK